MRLVILLDKSYRISGKRLLNPGDFRIELLWGIAQWTLSGNKGQADPLS